MNKLLCIVTYTLISALTFAYPSKVKSIIYLPIYQPIKIGFDQKSPAYIAFTVEDRHRKEEIDKDFQKNIKEPSNFNELVVIEDQQDFDQKKQKAKNTFEKNNINYNQILAGESVLEQMRFQKSEIQTIGTHLEVKGNIEFSGGLALTPEYSLEIRRRFEGMYKEVGQTNVEHGTYQIKINSYAGELVAQLRDSYGEVIGEGEYDLLNHDLSNQNSINKSDIKPNKKSTTITLRPTRNFFVRPYSHYDNKKKTAHSGTISYYSHEAAQNINAKGPSTYEGVAKNSAALAKAVNKDFYTTNVLVSSGEFYDLPLYPKSMIKAFSEFLKEEKNIEIDSDSGIVFGVVKFDEKSMANIKVQVEGYPDIKPIYFNEVYLPNLSQEQTSENGMFSFVNLPEGFYSVLATREGHYVGHKNIVVQKNVISNAEIKTTLKSNKVVIRSYDAFNFSTVDGEIELQGAEGSYTLTEGLAKITKTKILRQSLLICRDNPTVVDEKIIESGYLSSNFIYNDDNKEIFLPRIKRTWLESLVENENKADNGTLVGFVPEDDFTLSINFLNSNEMNPKQKIIYFDKSGNKLTTPDGVKGGGFVVTGLTEGTYEVIIESLEKNKRHSQIIPVESNSLTTLLFEE